MKRASALCVSDEQTYTDGDGVVPSKVIPDVVILELLYRFAPARARWATRSEETKERRKENDAQEVGCETDLDTSPSCEHDLLHLLVQIRRVSEAPWFTTQQCLRICRGGFRSLLNCRIPSQNLDFGETPNSKSVNRRTSAMCRVTPSPSARAMRKSSTKSVMSPAYQEYRGPEGAKGKTKAKTKQKMR